MENMKDLLVESYDANKVETHKQSIAKRAAAAGGAVAVTLGLFSFASCLPIVAGGAGAWFHSCTECECTECECTEDECTKDK